MAWNGLMPVIHIANFEHVSACWVIASVRYLPLSAGGRGGRGGGRWASDQIFKMGGLTGSQFLEEVARKEGVTFCGGRGMVAVFT